MAGIVGLTELQHTNGNSMLTVATTGDGNVKSEGGATTTSLRQGLAKTWVNFDGAATGAAASDSFNLTSMTDNGTGDYTVTINNDFSAATYACPISVGSGSGAGRYIGTVKDTVRATGSCVFFCLQSSSGSALDAPDYNISFHGDLA